MNAVLSIELELREPALVDSAERLLELHPSQIEGLSIRLTGGGDEGVVFESQADHARSAIQRLVAFAQKTQPDGTAVVAWYQGRAEAFSI